MLIIKERKKLEYNKHYEFYHKKLNKSSCHIPEHYLTVFDFELLEISWILLNQLHQ